MLHITSRTTVDDLDYAEPAFDRGVYAIELRPIAGEHFFVTADAPAVTAEHHTEYRDPVVVNLRQL